MLLLISVTFSMLVVAHVCIFFQRVAGQEGGERRRNRARKIEGGTTGVEREVVIGTIEEETFTAQSL